MPYGSVWPKYFSPNQTLRGEPLLNRPHELSVRGPASPVLREIFVPASLPTDGHFISLPGRREYECGKCGMTFVSEETLVQHDQRRHKPDVEEREPT